MPKSEKKKKKKTPGGGLGRRNQRPRRAGPAPSIWMNISYRCKQELSIMMSLTSAEKV
jgi:hypothetical protein